MLKTLVLALKNFVFVDSKIFNFCFSLIQYLEGETMELTDQINNVDQEIADIVNKLESLQVEEFDGPRHKEAIALLDNLVELAYRHTGRVGVYIDDIRECTNGLFEWYKEHDQSDWEANVRVANIFSKYNLSKK